MSEYKEKNNDLSFTYIDYRLSKNSLTIAQASNSVRNIGGNGQMVSKVYHGFEEEKSGGEVDKYMLGPYTASSPVKVGDQVGDLTQNLFYNNEFIYPQNVTNSAVHYHHLVSTEGAPAYVSRAAYSGEGEGITTQKYGGEAQDDDLLGMNFWQGFKLIDGQRLDSKGADLHTQITLTENCTNRVWLEVLRYATLKDGRMACYYA